MITTSGSENRSCGGHKLMAPKDSKDLEVFFGFVASQELTKFKDV